LSSNQWPKLKRKYTGRLRGLTPASWYGRIAAGSHSALFL